MIAEADPLRRVERTALVVCVVMAGAALIVARGRPHVAAGVVGGGLLAAVSYRAIKSGVTGLMSVVPAEGPASKNRSNPSRILARLVLRYALLALLAYVMIARLRLHPLGLLAGASSVVAAVSVEALRLLLKKS